MSEAGRQAALARWARPGERERCLAHLPALAGNKRGRLSPGSGRPKGCKGRAWTDEQRAKVSATNKRIGRVPPRSKTSGTWIEMKLKALLDATGVEYVFQFPVPGTRYVVDFYLPHRNMLVEADGEYWHRDTTRDEKRDTAFIALGYKVVHLSGGEIRRRESVEDLV